jgi:hypothetical protein
MAKCGSQKSKWLIEEKKVPETCFLFSRGSCQLCCFFFGIDCRVTRLDEFSPIRLCFNFDKKGLGYIFGDFFTNASGHPGAGLFGDCLIWAVP